MEFSLKWVVILLLVLEVLLIGFCSAYFHIGLLPTILCSVLSLVFSMIAVRVFAESGLSAGMALNLFMIFIAYGLTGSAMFALLMAFTNFNTFILAQDTMVDLKVGQMIQSSPLKQIKAQYIGIFCGSIAGALLFYGILQTFGLESDLFFYPFGRMYYSVAEGLGSGGLEGAFDLGRFLIGGGLGTLFSFAGLPTGAIALALYLAPKTILGLAVGGCIRFIIEKAKGDDTAVLLETAATGMVVGDALACVIVVIVTMFLF